MTTWRWIDTVTRQLELCKAGGRESAIVLGTDTDDNGLREIFTLSLERLGCEVAEVVVRSGAVLDGNDPVSSEPVARALAATDLVVDTSGDLINSSSARDLILKSARVLTIDLVAVGDIDHLVAHPGLGKRLQRAEELIEQGSALTVDSTSGTHLEMDLTDSTFRSESAVVVKPGEMQHWPAGVIFARPAGAEINGCVVAMPGDFIAETGHLIRSPVRIEIADGVLTDVLGDSTDADIIRHQLETVDDKQAVEIAEIGWGMNLTRGGRELSLFDPSRLTPGRGLLGAGQINIRTGTADTGTEAGLTLSLGAADLAIDDVELISGGSLSGALAPDIYERAAYS